MKLLLVFLILLTQLLAGEHFRMNGDVRLSYLNYRYDNRYFPNSEAGIISGKLSITTNNWNNLYATTSFVTVQGINHNKNRQGMSYTFSEAWNGVHNSYSLLEELYIGYKNSLLSFKIGRQEIDTPYVNSDDYFVVPDSFEAVTLAVTPNNNLKLHLGHVTKMSGTWDSSFNGAKFLSPSRQAWIHYKNATRDTYPIDAVYQLVGDQDITYLGGIYTNKEHTLNLWDFYTHEMLNTFMIQYDFVKKNYYFGLQYSTQRDVGKLKESIYKVNYDVYGLKTGTSLSKKWDLAFSYTGISDDDSLHFFGSWGGYPWFASGMMVTYFETYLRDSDIYALTSTHKLNNIADGLSIKFKYAHYDLNKNHTVNINKGSPNGNDYMRAYGVGLYYNYNKNLSWKLMLAGRKLDTGNQSELVRTVLKYKF